MVGLIILFLIILLILVRIGRRGKEQLYLPIIPDPGATHLFWTGGYDSTFRLCQLLITERKKVQPVYLSLWDLDSHKGLKARRKNVNKEIESQDKIRNELYKRFPRTKDLLLPTLHVEKLPSNPGIQNAYVRIHKNLGFFGRDITQYERMARFSWYYPYPLEVGVENCGTGLDQATRKNRVGKGRGCQLRRKLSEKEKDLEVFRRFRYPIVHLSKEQMWQEAKNCGYDKILEMTWSCWYPRNRQPCEKCEMCKRRIVQ